MKGDKIIIKPIYFKTAEEIIAKIPLQNSLNKYVIAIGGESGSGKSVAAVCIKQLLDQQNITTSIIHQDDYFFMPPKTNHIHRLQQIKHVGMDEVNLELLQSHILSFIHEVDQVEKPLIDYDLNIIEKELIQFKDVKVLLVEGTYTLSLCNVNLKIFMNRTYQETILQRAQRGREKFDEFIEKVLAIEHELVSKMKLNAHLIVNRDYEVHINSNCF